MLKLTISILICAIFFLLFFVSSTHASERVTTWPVQVIDTMKYSRDLARDKANNKTFEKTIEKQVKDIKDTGATHVAIDTPYDDEFLPFMKKWIASARKNNLKIWYRGNFAGWEGWFDYPRISRDQHLEKTKHFILSHPEIFEDGDIFSACMECENGGPGDPRATGDYEGHRLFLISEYQLLQEAFIKINKHVTTNLNSMNGGLAKIIMNRKTTEELGGLVVIDHYVLTPEELITDIDWFAKNTGGNVFLGEFGAPIPQIHGEMSPTAQADWIKRALTLVAKDTRVVGVNYWTGVGGSTAIWDETDGEALPARAVLKSFFIPKQISGFITTPFRRPINNAAVSIGDQTTTTDHRGYYQLNYFEENGTITVDSAQHGKTSHQIKPNENRLDLVIGQTPSNFIGYVLGYIAGLFSD